MEWLNAVLEAVVPVLKVVGAGAVSGTGSFVLIERGTPRGIAAHWKLLACVFLTGLTNGLLHYSGKFDFGDGPGGWAGVGFAALTGTAVAFIIHDHGENLPGIGGIVAGIKRKPAEGG